MKTDRTRTALVTNATGFAGPPAVEALLQAGFHVLAHDPSFSSDAEWSEFATGREGLSAISET